MCITFVFWFSVFPFLRKLNRMFPLKALNKDLFIRSLVLLFCVSDLSVRSSAAWFFLQVFNSLNQHEGSCCPRSAGRAWGDRQQYSLIRGGMFKKASKD